MNLELPADARVQIFITPANAFEQPDPDRMISIAAPAASVQPRRTLLKGTAGVIILVAVYALGNRAGLHANPALVQAQASAPAQPTGVPQRPGGVPPRFTQQLQQPPVLTPPPGSSSGSSAPTKGGFGLEE